MGRINLHNYEAFLLDYFEGNLSEELIGELKAFIISHSELGIGLDDTELPVLNEEQTGFEFKSTLCKTENDFPDEDLLNYFEGNLSPAKKLVMDARVQADPELAMELETLEKTLLSPDAAEIFGYKSELIKNEDDFVLNSTSIAFFENELSAKDKKEFETELLLNQDLQKELALLQSTKLSADLSIVFQPRESLKREARVVALFSFRMAMAAAILLVFGLIVVFAIYNSEPDFTKIELGKENINKKDQSNNKIKNKEIAPQPSEQLVADAAAKKVKKNKSVIKKKEPSHVKINEVNVVHNEKDPGLPVNNNSNEAIKDTALVNNTSNNNSSQTANETPVIRYTNVNALVVSKDSDEEVDPESFRDNKPEKKGFWKRAVKLAQQVNGLGIKAVKGNEKENENYSLSFNSFSVEKK